MSIDPFTFLAQLANFVLLAVLLWRFLFRPIARAMDEREHDLAAQRQAAADEIARASAERAGLEAERRELEQWREELLAAAERAAAEYTERARAAARSAVDQQQQRWTAAFEQRKAALLADFRAELGTLVCAATRRVFEDLAGPGLEAAMIERLLAELEGGESAAARELRQAGGSGGLVVRTSFELAEPQKARIARELARLVPAAGEARFERAADGVCGIELVAGERRLAWTVAGHLERVRRDLAAHGVMVESVPGGGGMSGGASHELAGGGQSGAAEAK